MSIRMLYQKDPTKMTIEELRTMCEFAAGGGGQHGFPDTTWAEKPPGRYCALCMTHHDESAFSAEDLATTEVISCQQSQQELAEWDEHVAAEKLKRKAKKIYKQTRQKSEAWEPESYSLARSTPPFWCQDCNKVQTETDFYPPEIKRADMSWEHARCKKHFLLHIVQQYSPRWYCTSCQIVRGIQYFPITGIVKGKHRTYTIGSVCCDCDMDEFQRTNIAAKVIKTQTGIPVPLEKRSQRARWYCPECERRVLLQRFAGIQFQSMDSISIPKFCGPCMIKQSLKK